MVKVTFSMLLNAICKCSGDEDLKSLSDRVCAGRRRNSLHSKDYDALTGKIQRVARGKLTGDEAIACISEAILAVNAIGKGDGFGESYLIAAFGDDARYGRIVEFLRASPTAETVPKPRREKSCSPAVSTAKPSSEAKEVVQTADKASVSHSHYRRALRTVPVSAVFMAVQMAYAMGCSSLEEHGACHSLSGLNWEQLGPKVRGYSREAYLADWKRYLGNEVKLTNQSAAVSAVISEWESLSTDAKRDNIVECYPIGGEYDWVFQDVIDRLKTERNKALRKVRAAKAERASAKAKNDSEVAALVSVAAEVLAEDGSDLSEERIDVVASAVVAAAELLSAGVAPDGSGEVVPSGMANLPPSPSDD